MAAGGGRLDPLRRAQPIVADRSEQALRRVVVFQCFRDDVEAGRGRAFRSEEQGAAKSQAMQRRIEIDGGLGRMFIALVKTNHAHRNLADLADQNGAADVVQRAFEPAIVVSERDRPSISGDRARRRVVAPLMDQFCVA